MRYERNGFSNRPPHRLKLLDDVPRVRESNLLNKMIMHNCIECDNFEMIPLAEGQLPVMQKFTCEKCQTTQWIKHSRLNPETYPEDMVEVDEENHSIKLKETT